MQKCNYPKYKTCGMSNPYYKATDFYYSIALGRNIHRCQLEDYYTKFLYEGVSKNPNQDPMTFYKNIVYYVKGMYNQLMFNLKIEYSNLDRECSAILLIKRCLARIFSEEEVSRISTLLRLEQSCDCME